jgi:hypothetical protein
MRNIDKLSGNNAIFGRLASLKTGGGIVKLSH